MNIPILHDHDPKNPIGAFSYEGGRLIVRFTAEARVTQGMFLQAFNAGAQFIDVDVVNGEQYIREAEIFEFSIGPGVG
jgi:hypothetical protein